jgi:hypothetical protein
MLDKYLRVPAPGCSAPDGRSYLKHPDAGEREERPRRQLELRAAVTAL